MADEEEISLSDFPDDFVAEAKGISNQLALAINADSNLEVFSADVGGKIFSLAELEKWAVERALRHTKGNIRQSARSLGITRSTMYKKIADYEIPR